MIKIQYGNGTYIIDNGIISSEEPEIEKVFNKYIDQSVLPWQGEPDFVLATRMIELMGQGSIVIKFAEQSDPETVY